MIGTDVDRSHQPGSQGCRAEVEVGVALDGDVLLLAKRARPNRSRRTNDIRLEGPVRSAGSGVQRLWNLNQLTYWHWSRVFRFDRNST